MLQLRREDRALRDILPTTTSVRERVPSRWEEEEDYCDEQGIGYDEQWHDCDSVEEFYGDDWPDGYKGDPCELLQLHSKCGSCPARYGIAGGDP